jgi:hypothetical protein
MLANAIVLLCICAGLSTAQSTSTAKRPTFAMSIRLKEKVTKPGSTITLDIDLTNTSDNEIVFFLPASAPLLYKWNVMTREGSPAQLTPVGNALAHGAFVFKGKNGEARLIGGGSVFSARVQPGKTLQDSIELSTYVDFSQPDEYKIRLQRTDQYTNIIVESNTVSLTVAR